MVTVTDWDVAHGYAPADLRTMFGTRFTGIEDQMMRVFVDRTGTVVPFEAFQHIWPDADRFDIAEYVRAYVFRLRKRGVELVSYSGIGYCWEGQSL